MRRQVIPRPLAARPGQPAPWAGLSPADRRGLTLDRVVTALPPGPRDAYLAAPPVDAPRRSAVLVALFEEAGEARVVLTRRSASLRTHTGEVAFPGGRFEPGEGPAEAALREASEEVGLEPATVEVVGLLSVLATVSSGSSITPVAGALPARPVLRPNPAEVDRAFDVALADLAADGVYREERWRLSGARTEGERAVHFFELPEDTVWGATARILRELLDLVLAG